MRRLIIEVSLEDMTSLDPLSRIRKIESLEVLHILRQERESFEGIFKIIFKDSKTRIEEIFPLERAQAQLLSEDKKSGSHIYFIKVKIRDSHRYLFGLGTASSGYLSLPSEIKDQKVRMSFLGSSKDIKDFLKKLKKSWPDYKLVSLTDAKFSMNSPLSHLTEKQRKVLLTAFNLGYYETPRRVSSIDLAQKLNIDSSTLIVHRRKAEQSTLAQIINNENNG